MSDTSRSAESYEREIAGLSKSLSDECVNSYRLAQELARAKADPLSDPTSGQGDA